jgi:glycosyltransferase involved in cell wall biosynthesis
MRITFALSGFARVPVGGYAVVFEYANQLSRRGHDVTVIQPSRWLRHDPIGRVRAEIQAAVEAVRRPLPAGGRPTWFGLDDAVKTLTPPRLTPAVFPDADAVVATAWETASLVAGLPGGKGRRYQLIQHYETWAGNRARIDASWRLPLHKIVISRWLARVAERLDAPGPVTYIPNGIDLHRFRLVRPIEDRPPGRIGLLSHRWAWKGTADGLSALSAARDAGVDVDVVLFGTDQPPSLPDWVTYHRNVQGEALVELYNSFAVFLHPSWMEGWPLPPAEAMACGAALTGYANDGVCDYATDQQTALLAPVHDVDALAAAIRRVVTQPGVRMAIARAGHTMIQDYTWDRATDRLEQLLLSGGAAASEGDGATAS